MISGELPKQVAIVMPVYDDWDAARELLPLLDEALARTPCRAEILLIDDGSTLDAPREWPQGLSHIAGVSLVRLRRNLGHQRAIAIGLVYAYQNLPSIEALIVMDSDGEDRPRDIPALLERFWAEGGRKVVFAARSKRLESGAFQFFYHSYRLVHKALTGISVRVGNFSVLPPQAVSRLTVVSELWNHYAAAVFRARLPRTSIPLPRGSRLAGHSHMNFVSLLVHGLGAISVFSDIAGARLLALAAFSMVITVALIATVASVRLFTALAIPGWATYVTGILLIILAQTVVVALALVFTIVSGRAASSFLPLRDAPLFVDYVERVFPAP